ncbi:MAG: acyl-CoA dehydrogenase family protein [Acidimicrobiales bacterium]
MDFDDTPAEAAFRAEARAWLTEHAVPKGHPDDVSRAFFDPGADWDELIARCVKWQRTLFDGGWAGISYPTEYGGRGGTVVEELIFAEEMDRFGVTNGAFMVAHTMVGPALLAFGTEAQRRRHVEAMLRGDELWCQLFSEPGAGSDLAALSTRAVLDGDEWVVNGQKVWTSNSTWSNWAILLARTDPDAPRHRGITYFLVDMASPGIEIRPLRQMTGEAHFSEVFLDDVRLPAEQVLGGLDRVNDGWRAAMHTLSNERAMIGTAPTTLDTEGLLALAAAHDRLDDPVVRDELAAAIVRTRIVGFLALRVQTAIRQGREPGPESSVVKLFFTEHVKRVGALALELEGPAGMVDARADWPGYFTQRFLFAPSLTIAGGSSEVQRNIIGERVLGLPGEPKVTG